MKVVFSSVIAWIMVGLGHAETEAWYDWQGRKLGELPREFPAKTQPQDLIAHDQVLVRLKYDPWSGERRYRRISDWYRGNYIGYSYPWTAWRIPCGSGQPMRRSNLQIWYGNGGAWGINYQRPGFSLHWHH